MCRFVVGSGRPEIAAGKHPNNATVNKSQAVRTIMAAMLAAQGPEALLPPRKQWRSRGTEDAGVVQASVCRLLPFHFHKFSLHSLLFFVYNS